MDDSACVDKQTLALDALSNLTGRFCEKPDFEELIGLLLMTLCGQFSVASAFALLFKPSSQSLNETFFATGDFMGSAGLKSLSGRPADWSCLVRDRKTRRARDLEDSPCARSLSRILQGAGVVLVSPLIHHDDFFGVIGLGERITNGSYSNEDMDLLNTVTNTVTPLVANSYLFSDIANLKAWYLEILNNVRQGVFVFDRAFRLRKVNAAGIEILNLSGAEPVTAERLDGEPMDRVFPDAAFAGWVNRFKGMLGNGETVINETAVASLGGGVRVFNVDLVESKEGAGPDSSFIMTLEDMTVQKQREQRLFDLQIVADRGKMASTIAHELNNFLTLLMGGVELLSLALEDDDKPRARETMERLTRQVINLERFSRGLTDFGSIGADRRMLSLNSLIEDVLTFISVQRKFKELRIIPVLSESLPDIRIDKDQITQVLLNMLANAADAIKESDRADGRIILRTRTDGDMIALQVSDNGPGLKPGVKDRLFSEHITTKRSGHGFGLVTSARIIRAHGGRIEVQSQPGEGATFTILLPAGKEA
jgi:signal transduction histidine kinase